MGDQSNMYEDLLLVILSSWADPEEGKGGPDSHPNGKSIRGYNGIQNFHMERYIVRYTVKNWALR